MEGEAWRCALEGDEEGMTRELEQSDSKDWIESKEGLDGSTPLHGACNNGHLKVVKLLVSSGANINCTDKDGSTPLHKSCYHGHLDVAKLLVSSGAEVNCTDKDGSTPLHKSCYHGHLDVAKLLVSSGAEVNCTDKDGSTLLHWASGKGHLDIVQFLVSSGAEVNCTNGDGGTPLHWACINGCLKIVKHLIFSGADVNCTDNEGDTILHKSCQSSNETLACFLVRSFGVDPTTKNNVISSCMLILLRLISYEQRGEMSIDYLQYNAAKYRLISIMHDARHEATMLNDDARGGVDRLGHACYGKALANLLKNANPPVCVGLYAKWGSGKSFLMELIKRAFDNSCQSDERHNRITQWYEPTFKDNDNNYDCCSCDAWFGRMKYLLCWSCWGFSAVVESLPYMLLTLLSIVCDIFIDILSLLLKFLIGLVFGRASAQELNRCSELLPCFSTAASSENKDRNYVTEFVFVDYNAWEFSSADELWAGLIRNLYQKVEMRLSQNFKTSNSEEGAEGETCLYSLFQTFECLQTGFFDYKRKWRIRKAKQELEASYGGKIWLQLLLVALLSVFGGLVSVIVFWRRIFEDVINVVVYVLVSVAFLLPAAQLVWRTYHDSRSRGDAIYTEAKHVKDEVGFMARVKQELDELFAFMLEYRDETGIELRLVLFIDDLDRCLEGRNVKVLEALHLILEVSGAPVIAFLAIDPTVVVSSIETALNSSMNTNDALITGWEYLDKIVHLPFCVPDAPPELLGQLVVSCLNKKPPSATEVAEKLRRVVEFAERVNDKNGLMLCKINENEYYTVQKFLSDMKKVKDVKPLDEYPPLELLQLAGALLTEECRNAVLQVRQSHSEGVGEEALCRRVNDVLCNFDLLTEAYQSSPLNQNSPQHMSTVQLSADAEDFSRRQPRCSRMFDEILSEQKTGHVSVTKPSSPKGKEDVKGGVKIMDKHKHDEKLKKSFLLQGHQNRLEDLAFASVPKEMNEMLQLFCKFSDASPRRLKRVVNLVQLASEVSQVKPVSLEKPEDTIDSLEGWKGFSRKLVKWIYLCENYPYRISFLVLLVTSWDKKRLFNGVRAQTRERGGSNDEQGTDRDENLKTDLSFEYRGVKHEDEYGHLLESVDDETLASFYIKYVAGYVYGISNAKKLLRLDGDPEQFTSGLSMCVDTAKSTGDNITVGDLLGPAAGDAPWGRDSNLSLLSYSFNLHPAMGRIIRNEIAQLISPHELFAVSGGDGGAALPRPHVLLSNTTHHGAPCFQPQPNKEDDALGKVTLLESDTQIDAKPKPTTNYKPVSLSEWISCSETGGHGTAKILLHHHSGLSSSTSPPLDITSIDAGSSSDDSPASTKPNRVFRKLSFSGHSSSRSGSGEHDDTKKFHRHNRHQSKRGRDTMLVAAIDETSHPNHEPNNAAQIWPRSGHKSGCSDGRHHGSVSMLHFNSSSSTSCLQDRGTLSKSDSSMHISRKTHRFSGLSRLIDGRDHKSSFTSPAPVRPSMDTGISTPIRQSVRLSQRALSSGYTSSRSSSGNQSTKKLHYLSSSSSLISSGSNDDDDSGI